MSAAEDLIVHWEDDPAKTRAVVGFCQVCYPKGDVGGDIWIVSPAGLAHHIHMGEAWADRTYCGKAATGADWWRRT